MGVWFITGAGRGMGLDITKAALAAGHQVVGMTGMGMASNMMVCFRYAVLSRWRRKSTGRKPK